MSPYKNRGSKSCYVLPNSSEFWFALYSLRHPYVSEKFWEQDEG